MTPASIFVVSAVRTAIGSFGGALKDVPLAALAITVDEHPRADTTLETLARMKPAFKKEGGSVTAGNASGINDGAGAVMLATEAAVKFERV
jgi:acetyl-CoA acetyltransferase